MVDVKGTAIKLEVSSLNLGSSVGGLEADKGKRHLAIFLLEELEGFDLTKCCEEVLKILFGGFGGKVLHIQVAALLGVLVLEGLVGKLLLTLVLLKSWLTVELFAIEIFVVHSLNSFGGTVGSILTVSRVSSTVANKGVWSD